MLAGAAHAEPQATITIEPVETAPPSTGDAATATPGTPPVATDLWDRSNLLGDWAGLRPFLGDHGIAVSLYDYEDGQGDVTGGMRRGSGYGGATFLLASANLETLVGWTGGSIGLAVGEIRGHGVSQFDTGNLLTVSNIETQPETRIFDLYLEQSLLDQHLTVRAGQMLSSEEFVTSHYASALTNSSFNYPVLLGADLPGDDPVSVVSTPALWAKYTGDGPVSLQAGLYKGASSNLAGPLESRVATSSGAGVLVMAEAAYSIRPTADGTLPAVFKLGGWYHSASFDDLALDRNDNPLALGFDAPRRHNGDYGGYALVDKMLYSVPGTSDQGLGVFARVAGAPGDRNLISLYVDAGLDYKGLFHDRPDDHVALGFAWARASSGAKEFDDVLRIYYGPDYPVRDEESAIELTYQAAVTPWLTVQPDLQYIVHPGLGAPDPEQNPGEEIERTPNAFVAGLRGIIKF